MTVGCSAAGRETRVYSRRLLNAPILDDMSAYFSDQSIAVRCPQCKKEFKRTVAQLKRRGNTCPHCDVVLDSKQFSGEIDRAEKASRNWK